VFRDIPVEYKRLNKSTGLLKFEEFLDLLRDSRFSVMSFFYRSRWYSFKIQDTYTYKEAGIA
jgi:hypothetical protein